VPKSNGWIGVDFDGTLAHHTSGQAGLGAPLQPMLRRVKRWLADGKDVRIVTARVNTKNGHTEREAIKAWLKKHVGQELPVTASKSPNMTVLYDDRAVRMVKNTGRVKR